MDQGIVDQLAAPLERSLVSTRQGSRGAQVPYIEGHAIIGQANRIFGYGGWGYELLAEPSLRTVDLVNRETGEVHQQQAYIARVRVSITGAVDRIDVGLHAVEGANIEAHDTAVKGAVTDALKRALRSFGAQFGNDLYDKSPQQPAQPVAQGDAPAKPSGMDVFWQEMDKYGKDRATVEALIGGPVGERLKPYMEERGFKRLSEMVAHVLVKTMQTGAEITA